MTASDAAIPGRSPDDRSERAVAAALAATRGEPVADTSRPARRAAHVIAAIRSHRPDPGPAGPADSPAVPASGPAAPASGPDTAHREG